jgi:hypothetical protein
VLMPNQALGETVNCLDGEVLVPAKK